MRLIYILFISILLFSCGTQRKDPRIDKEGRIRGYDITAKKFNRVLFI
jgi:hypothetical protein